MKSLSNLVTGLALFASSTAFALEADLRAFLTNAEGIWRGNGQITQMVQGGKSRSMNYLVDFGIRHPRENRWRVGMRFVFEDGGVSTPWGLYQVSGDNLIVITSQMNEPVNVVSVGPNNLFYKFNHSDAATGRVYSYSYKYAICAGGVFKGEVLASLNDVIIAQEHFEAKKETAQDISFSKMNRQSAEMAEFCNTY